MGQARRAGPTSTDGTEGGTGLCRSHPRHSVSFRAGVPQRVGAAVDERLQVALSPRVEEVRVGRELAPRGERDSRRAGHRVPVDERDLRHGVAEPGRATACDRVDLGMIRRYRHAVHEERRRPVRGGVPRPHARRAAREQRVERRGGGRARVSDERMVVGRTGLAEEDERVVGRPVAERARADEVHARRWARDTGPSEPATAVEARSTAASGRSASTPSAGCSCGHLRSGVDAPDRNTAL